MINSLIKYALLIFYFSCDLLLILVHVFVEKSFKFYSLKLTEAFLLWLVILGLYLKLIAKPRVTYSFSPVFRCFIVLHFIFRSKIHFALLCELKDYVFRVFCLFIFVCASHVQLYELWESIDTFVVPELLYSFDQLVIFVWLYFLALY